MLRVTGEVVRYEQTPWNIDGKNGIKREARVLVGKADFVDVQIREDQVAPREGDQVDWAVVASAPGGRLRVTRRGDWEALVPTADGKAPLRAAK